MLPDGAFDSIGTSVFILGGDAKDVMECQKENKKKRAAVVPVLASVPSSRPTSPSARSSVNHIQNQIALWLICA